MDVHLGWYYHSRWTHVDARWTLRWTSTWSVDSVDAVPYVATEWVTRVVLCACKFDLYGLVPSVTHTCTLGAKPYQGTCDLYVIKAPLGLLLVNCLSAV